MLNKGIGRMRIISNIVKTLPKRQGSTLKVRLLQPHETLGSIGDIVNVKAGYARNCLIPKKIATYISPTELRLRSKADSQSSSQTRPEGFDATSSDKPDSDDSRA